MNRRFAAAHSPEEVHTLFAQYFSAGELDGLMSLYEPDATFVSNQQTPVNGAANIRETLALILERGGKMELTVFKSYSSDDIALLLSDWTIYHENEAGRSVVSSGRTSDVVRRQPDGRWLLIIDNPGGVASPESK